MSFQRNKCKTGVDDALITWTDVSSTCHIQILRRPKL